MSATKKSLEWLKSMELNAQDAKKFHDSVKKPVSKANLKKQRNIFRVARNLNAA